MNVLFTSKANVLSYLKPNLKNSKIEKIFFFTVSDWYKNKKAILYSIQTKFGTKKIIIRSSALDEDTVNFSGAGQYKSILHINANSTLNVSRSIEEVIDSYHNTGINPQNQVLVQYQTNNVKMSGVVFTRSNDNGSPYYIINFEEGDSTEGVTHGKIGNTVKIFRNSKIVKNLKKWKPLLNSIKEIEKLTKSSFLDIEFGVTNSNKIVIFQVRPITSIQNHIDDMLDIKISMLIEKNKKLFSNLTHSLLYPTAKTIFSDMSDWNPSEIIGTNPKPLDYSLYDYLIMEKSWSLGRSNIGYQNVNSQRLMKKFGNKPYVDVRASFNSLIPNKIDKKLKTKLMDFYLDKLSENHDLHDKVEFNILFTCYDFTIDDRLKELLQHDFSKNEIHILKNHLLDFTNKIIKNFPNLLQESENSIKQLESYRDLILSNVDKNNYESKLESAENLLFHCKNHGAVPFSTMARIAFISTIILKSLSIQRIDNSFFYDEVMNSITTVLTEFQQDFNTLNKKQMRKSDFLKKYGHLRPGTYDISQYRYDTNNAFFDNFNFTEKNVKKSNKKSFKFFKKIMSDALQHHSLHFDDFDFLFFLQNSLSQREKLKFFFTKNLSDSLELITEAGYNLGFSRDELGYLTIKDLFNDYKKFKKNQLIQIWTKKIKKNKTQKLLNDYLNLPPIISSNDDFELIKYYHSKPNFITEKSIIADVVLLKNKTLTISDMTKKIIVLENADPGFDWIFTKNPSGLITKYGGTASHMAIRCAELGLPASIGCGEVLYEHLKRSSKVMLDCKNNHIIILEQFSDNEFVEEKKILKSLGYIK